LKKLPGRFVVDGEIVILDSHGKSRFQLLQNYPKEKKGTPYYYLFDILELNGRKLTQLPLIERKAILKKMLSVSKTPHIRFSEHVLEKGAPLFKKPSKKSSKGSSPKKWTAPTRAAAAKTG